MDIIQVITQELKVEKWQVEAAVKLETQEDYDNLKKLYNDYEEHRLTRVQFEQAMIRLHEMRKDEEEESDET